MIIVLVGKQGSQVDLNESELSAEDKVNEYIPLQSGSQVVDLDESEVLNEKYFIRHK